MSCLLVLAGSFKQYKLYCAEKGLTALFNSHVVYANSIHAVLGRPVDTKWVIFGTFFNRSDASKILNEVYLRYPSGKL